MYRVMLVEDDAPVRERLKTLIDWEKMELCGEAAEGEEALALFEQAQPHIVVTDINIPLVDGLELTRRLKARSPQTQVVVITGYGTMSYAQEAIRLGAADFLLKPVDKAELNKALSKARSSLDERTETLTHIRQMEAIVKESLPLLRERYLLSLMAGEPSQEEEAIRRHLLRLGLKIAGKWFCACVVTLEDQGLNEGRREELLLALSNMTGELAAEAGFTATVCADAQMRLVALVQMQSPQQAQALDEVLVTARDRLRYTFKVDCAAGIGAEVSGLRRLYQSCADATRALQYRALYARNNVVNIKNVFVAPAGSLRDRRKETERMLSAFLAEDREQTFQAIGLCLSGALAESGGAYRHVQRECVILLGELIAAAGEIKWTLNTAVEEDPYLAILGCRDAMDAQQALLRVAGQLLDALAVRRTRRSHQIIQRAQAYIGENLGDPTLNLTRVSTSVGLSSIYFCSLFKQETGQTLSEYINLARVEKAKVLLAATDEKIASIAQQVGYANPSYFFEVFKRLTGERPRDYANRCKK